MRLSDVDRGALRARGRDPELVEAWLARLSGAPPWTRLDAPATVGDGIVVLDDAAADAAEEAFEAAVDADRVSCFVPASGAATRMVAALRQVWSEGVRPLEQPWGPLEDARLVLSHARSLALWDELRAAGAGDDVRSVLDAMFGPGGVGLDARPKALVPFHRHGERARTALAEQVAEVVALLGEDARLHVTASEAHVDAFLDHLAAVAGDVSVAVSTQDAGTDLPSLVDGSPAREASGAIAFRPGGHGALLRNLHATGADVLLLKNVDNVRPAPARDEVVAWRRRLGGLLVDVQAQAHEHVRALRVGQGRAAAAAFAAQWLGLRTDDVDVLRERLARPWRVAGMVKNEGQPGGGPFWAWSRGERSLQIVESAQVDVSDPAQAALLRASTHFNPVELALGLRDVDGKLHDLSAWVDPDACIVTAKVQGGRALRVAEHPGLWNGSMAGWNTVFVETPAAVFAPVKTLADLLRVTHGGPLP